MSTLRGNIGLLTFGFALTFFASFGKTFYIALFSDPIRETFGLSHGGFASVYALATLTSAGLVAMTGGLLDRMDLQRFALISVLGLVVSCILMALVPAESVFFLYAVLLGLRFFGMVYFSK